MENEEKKRRIEKLRSKLEAPKTVCSPEEMIPFAWRFRLVCKDGKGTSKLLRTMLSEQAERENRIIKVDEK